MTPGPYKVSVRTAVGISNEVAFTVQPQSSAGSMKAASYDLTGIYDLKLTVELAGFFAGIFRGPYYEKTYDDSSQCDQIIQDHLVELGPASEYIDGLWVDGDMTNKLIAVWEAIVINGTFNITLSSEFLGTCKAFIFESCSAIAKYAPNAQVEEALRGLVGDLETYIHKLPPNGDTTPPNIVFDEVPETISKDTAEYTVSAIACENVFANTWSGGLCQIVIEAYLKDSTEPFASRDSLFDHGIGYYQGLDLKFKVPAEAKTGDKIRIVAKAYDYTCQEGKVSAERIIGTTYRAPKILKTPTPTLTPDEVADASALGAAQVYFQCTDSGNDIDKLNVEMVGENLKSRTPYSVSASTLGIPAGGGTVQKTLLSVFGNLTNINNYFDFTKDGWVMLRFWFTDRAGLNGSSATVFLYINSPSDNVEVFKFTVGDVTADDDSFGVALPSWGVDTHSTRIGQTETFVALLSDIRPDQTYVELRIQCDYSGPDNVGSCVVKLQDGARFSDSTTQKSNNLTYNPGQATPWVLSIRAPQPVKPPRPGT